MGCLPPCGPRVHVTLGLSPSVGWEGRGFRAWWAAEGITGHCPEGPTGPPPPALALRGQMHADPCAPGLSQGLHDRQVGRRRH